MQDDNMKSIIPTAELPETRPNLAIEHAPLSSSSSDNDGSKAKLADDSPTNNKMSPVKTTSRSAVNNCNSYDSDEETTNDEEEEYEDDRYGGKVDDEKDEFRLDHELMRIHERQDDYVICRRSNSHADSRSLHEELDLEPLRLQVEKSVIIHRDEHGFGLRLKGEQPVLVEHVHQNGASWRAGVRVGDLISKVNGLPVSELAHKDVVLMFKNCSRFIGLSLITSKHQPPRFEQTTATPKSGVTRRASASNTSHRKQLDNDYENGDKQQAPGRQFRLFQGQTDATDRMSLRSNSSKRPASSSFRRSRNNSLVTSGVAADNKRPAAAKNNLVNVREQAGGLSSEANDNEESKVANNLNENTSRSSVNVVKPPQITYTSAIEKHERRRQSVRTLSCSLLPLTNDSSSCSSAAAASLESGAHSARSARAPVQVNVLLANQQPAKANSHQSTAMSRFFARSSSRKETPVGAHSSNRSGRVCTSCQSLNQPQSDQIQSADSNHENSSDLVLCLKCQSPNLANNNNTQQHQEQTSQLKSEQHQKSTPINYKSVDTDKRNPDPSAEFHSHKHKLNHSVSTYSLPMDSQNKQLQQVICQQQQTTRNNPLDPTQPGLKMPVNKRLEIIREFINTEKAHTERLSCLNQLFCQPLKAGGYMTQEQLRAVFSCHRKLYRIHRQIHKILVSANYGFYLEPLIGSALLEIFEGPLKRQLERASCTFCAAQATNRDLLDKLTRRDTKTGDFIAQVTSQQITSRLGIKDLLASCFQRLTKYPLLLENLLKATPKSPPEEMCLKSMQLMAGLSAGAALNGPGANAKPSSEYPSQNDQFDPVLQSRCQESEKNDSMHQAMKSSCDGNTNPIDNENGKCVSSQNQQARRMLAISLAEEREFIERALVHSRDILMRVNESVTVAITRHKLKEIWKRTDKYPGVPLKDISNQHLIHDGSLTLRLSKRTYDVYMLLLNDYIILLTREGQDKYRLKFFTSENKFVVNQSSALYSPLFVIDEHLTTRDAATDENVFYLLCKRKDDSRIYEFATRSAHERLKWRENIQFAIERQMNKANRRPSCESSITKSSSEISGSHKQDTDQSDTPPVPDAASLFTGNKLLGIPFGLQAANDEQTLEKSLASNSAAAAPPPPPSDKKRPSSASNESTSSSSSTNLVGTISYVEDDGIIEANRVVYSSCFVQEATRVSLAQGQ